MAEQTAPWTSAAQFEAEYRKAAQDGLTMDAFAASNGLSHRRLYHWKARFEEDLGRKLPSMTAIRGAHFGSAVSKDETNREKLAALHRENLALKQDNKRLAEVSIDLECIRRIIGKIDAKIITDAPPFDIRHRPGKLVHGTPTLMLSDLHFGEVVFPAQVNHVNAYNTQTAKVRLTRVVEGAVKLLRQTLAPGAFGGMVCILGGDMVEGTIHDELRDTSDETVMEAVITLHDELVPHIKALCDEFGRLHLPCVVGNHGRLDRKPRMKNGPKLNYDWLLYHFIARTIGADPKYRSRVTFQIPDGYEASYRVHGVRYMLTHGDSFKGGDGISGPLMPWMRGSLKASKSYSAMGMPFDVMVMGHWHQLRYLGSIIVNGSLVGYNEFAQKLHFGFEPPQQALWLTHPVRGLTFQEAVFADESKPQGERDWVSIHKAA
jgi:hypothetical protein